MYALDSQEFASAVPLRNQFERDSQHVSEPHGDIGTKSGHQISYCDEVFLV